MAYCNTTDRLKDVTLKGVIPLQKELGRGAYGRVFAVKYCGVICAAKEIHQILIDAVNPEEKQAIKDSFIRECLHCSSLHHPNIVRCMHGCVLCEAIRRYSHHGNGNDENHAALPCTCTTINRKLI